MKVISHKDADRKRKRMDELREEIKEQLNMDTEKEQKYAQKPEPVQEPLREAAQQEAAQEHLRENYPWIVFGLNGTEYGVNSKHVLSIEILDEITPIVDAAPYCPGITRSRGDLIELLDLRALFGLGDYTSVKSDDQSDRHMMVVTETDNVKRGMLVDKIVSVEYVTELESHDAEHDNAHVSSKYISHVARREKLDTPVLIIKPESLIA